MARFREDHAMLTSAAASEEIDADVLSTHAIGLDVTLTNSSDSIGAIKLWGRDHVISCNL